VASGWAQERTNSLGVSVDVVGGRSNSLLGSTLGSSGSSKQFFFYGTYPSIALVSTGRRSAANVSYAFGLNRTTSGDNLHSHSHNASLKWSLILSPRWKVSASDSFQVTDDSATFNGLRGIAPPVDDFRFVFSPVAAQLTTRTNSAGVDVERTLDSKASLRISGSHSLLLYGSGQEATTIGSLSDQQRVTGGMTYNRRVGAHDTWGLSYRITYFDFATFENSASQVGAVTYSTQLGRDLTLQMSVGASQLKYLNTQQTFVGFDASTSLQKNIRDNSLTLYYSQNSNDSSGLGSISNTRQAGFSLGRNAKRATAFVSISAFETRGQLGNDLSARGLQAAASMGIPLTRTVSMQGGAQYQVYDHTSPFAFDQKRIFVSLRYNNPNLVRFSR